MQNELQLDIEITRIIEITKQTSFKMDPSDPLNQSLGTVRNPQTYIYPQNSKLIEDKTVSKVNKNREKVTDKIGKGVEKLKCNTVTGMEIAFDKSVQGLEILVDKSKTTFGVVKEGC